MKRGIIIIMWTLIHTFDFWVVEGFYVDLSIVAGGLSGGVIGDNSQIVAPFGEFCDEGVVNGPMLETGVHKHS